MKTLQRVCEISFLVALMFATVATVSLAGQTTPSAADQSASYPANQAPPPPADQATTSSAGQQVDPPGRVARLEYMTGSVSVQPHGTDEWVQGSVNRPLTIADNVWADKDSRAELNLGTGFVRIGSETSLTLTNVTNDAVQMQLHQGTLNLHIRKLYGGEVYEIDTPNQAFTVTKAGEYRVDVDPTGDSTLVTVWKGEGEATGQGPAVRVHEGQQARFTSGNSLEHQIKDAPGRDGFDEWCRLRDRREDESVSARYVAPGTVGATDLDEYGSWRDTPDYGHVWVPTAVAPGWAPYRYGHWAWIDPWGWTWVDDAPWGFAPFHYGRWVDFDGYWGWAPGPYWVRPWYAPALVAWFGGPGWGVGFGFGFGGGFGWCPLGFGEPFFPWYGVSRGYFRNINITNTRIVNITNITNNYYNTRARGGGFYGRNGIATPRYAARTGAFTAVSRNTLERGLPVASNAARISPGALRNLPSIGRPNVTPARDAMLGPKALSHPSTSAASRPTFSRMTPPAMSRPSSGRNFGKPAAANNTMASGRMPEGRSTPAASIPAPAGHFIPRPPASLGSSNPGSVGRGLRPAPARPQPTQMAMNRDIPHPPQSGVRSLSQPGNSMARSGRSMPSASPLSRSVPRPPEGSFTRPSMTAHNIAPESAARSYGNSSFGRSIPSSVPRPTGRITPAPREYPSARSQGSYSARSYGGNVYGGNRGYSASPYGGSYGGRSYSAPSRNYGSYGGRSYSAPSSHSYGGYSGGSGSHGSSGSYHGSSSGGSSSHGGHFGR